MFFKWSKSAKADAAQARERALRFTCLALGPLTGRDLPSCDDVDWSQVIAMASSHLVTPALGWTLRGRISDPDVQAYFSAMLTLNAQRNAVLLEALPPILSTLNRVDARPVLIKGAAALADGLYPTSGCRLMGDIDILVREERLAAASAALSALGYLPTSEGKEAGFVAVREESHHLPMQVNASTGVGIELHAALTPSAYRKLLPSATCIERSQAGILQGERYGTLCATDRVVLNITHAQLNHRLHDQGRIDLRQLMELACIDRRDREHIDWPRIEALFQRTGHAQILANQTFFLKELLGWSIPPRFDARSAGALQIAMRPPASKVAAGIGRAREYLGLCRSQPTLLLNLMHPRWIAGQMRNL